MKSSVEVRNGEGRRVGEQRAPTCRRSAGTFLGTCAPHHVPGMATQTRTCPLVAVAPWSCARYSLDPLRLAELSGRRLPTGHARRSFPSHNERWEEMHGIFPRHDGLLGTLRTLREWWERSKAATRLSSDHETLRPARSSPLLNVQPRETGVVVWLLTWDGGGRQSGPALPSNDDLTPLTRVVS